MSGSGAKVKLAIYDLDRTITLRPTWTPFLLHAAWRRARWRLALVPVAAAWALAHQLGLVDRRRLKGAMHRLMIGSLPAEELAAISTRFATEFAARFVAPGARARIAADRSAGYRIVVASAAHRFYAAPLVAAIGITDLVATEATRDAAGRVTPEVAGDNCYGPAKLALIRGWMADAGIDRDRALVRFYSDHASDAPTFAWADEPFAVNPHRRLRRMAAARGWPILDWRTAADA